MCVFDIFVHYLSLSSQNALGFYVLEHAGHMSELVASKRNSFHSLCLVSTCNPVSKHCSNCFLLTSPQVMFLHKGNSAPFLMTLRDFSF